MEKQILEQQLDLTKKISQLKENESIERQTCKWWCGISHQKHSWKKSPSKELYAKFQKLTKVSIPDEKNFCNIFEINLQMWGILRNT